MNKITLKELEKITKIEKKANIQDEELFEYIRIVSLNNIKYEEITKNTLYFIIYSEDEENNDGWYVKPIDTRPFIHDIINKYPNSTFVIEPNLEKELLNSTTKYLVVKNIHHMINDLFHYYQKKSHAKAIAITGSVGKTTCVGLIENVLKQKYNVLRIYSKRITPLGLKAYIINLLDDKIDYIVTEISLFYHDHVKILTDLLKPEIVAILNIKSAHLGVDILKTQNDICRYKSFIMQYAKKAFLPSNDIYLNRLSLKNDKLIYNNKILFTNNNLNIEFININDVIVKKEEMNINNEMMVKPFFLSNLSKLQFLIAYNIAKELNINNEMIKKGMDTYVPVENRLQKKRAFTKEIIFDGDITTPDRLKEMAYNNYEKKYLVIRKVGCSEEYMDQKKIKTVFNYFDKVFIFDDTDYFDNLDKEKNVVIVNNHDFMNDLDGTIIYHYSGYYRVWKDYDENTLNIYDNKIYPVLKERIKV